MTLRPAFNRTWLGILLLLAAAVFTVGSLVERSTVHIDTHSAAIVNPPEGSPGHVEGAGATESGTASEIVFGLNLESPGVIAAVVVTSVALALAVWFWDLSVVLLLVLLFGLGAAIFDAREVVHQAQESRGALSILATLTMLLHLGVAGIAGRVWQRTSRAPAPAVSGASATGEYHAVETT